MKTIINSERLLLREFDSSDAAAMYNLNKDPEVIKYTGDPPFTSLEGAQAFLDNYAEYKKNGFGRWAVIKKANNTFIGWCGLKRRDNGLIDIGFRFLKSEWGKGFATESARACLKYGFNILNLEEIIGRALIVNTASIHVLEKLQMKFWKEDDSNGITNCLYYRISRSQYQ